MPALIDYVRKIRKEKPLDCNERGEVTQIDYWNYLNERSGQLRHRKQRFLGEGVEPRKCDPSPDEMSWKVEV